MYTHTSGFETNLFRFPVSSHFSWGGGGVQERGSEKVSTENPLGRHPCLLTHIFINLSLHLYYESVVFTLFTLHKRQSHG